MLSLRSLAYAALFAPATLAAVVTEDFRIGWVRANPDGVFERPVIGINGAWPVPLITATVGDRLMLTVHNDLGNASTSLHFHGFFQNGTNHRDGAVGVTQCPIPPGESFTYDLEFAQAGTYWYHSHNRGQYMDGLRGAIVVHDPAGPYEGAYDDELVLTVSDWYHTSITEMLPEFINVENPTGAEPVPPAALLNDTRNLKVSVQPGKTYLVHLANVGGFASHYVWFAGHTMRIVEVDGVWTEPADASMVYITAAQRYSFLLTTKNDTDANFAIVAAMDEEMFDVIPDGQNSNVTGWLVYDDQKPLVAADFVSDFDSAHDDFLLVPYDAQPLLETVDHSFSLDVKMDILGDGANYAFFNDETYVRPKVPSLYTAMTVGTGNNTNPIVYGTHTNSYVLRHNDVVEVVLNNYDDGRHPFHLHGHNFQVVRRSDEDAGPYVPPVDDDFAVSDANANANIDADADALPAIPMRRDTVYVEGNGHFVIRFRADNPGVWLFHCHIEWHMDQGLVATFIEAPAELLADPRQAIPESHLAVCKAAGVPSAGNAAGNTHDVFDLRGENAPPKPLPEGFTAKGYVALFFSTVSALLGMAVISWYGLLDPNINEVDSEHEPLIQE